MNKHNRLVAVCALRYCIGRVTYIVNECVDYLIEIWPDLDEGTQALIQRELDLAFEADDADRRAGYEIKALGHDQDREEWQRLRDHINSFQNGNN